MGSCVTFHLQTLSQDVKFTSCLLQPSSPSQSSSLCSCFSLLSLYCHWDVHKQLWVSCLHNLPCHLPSQSLALSSQQNYAIQFSCSQSQGTKEGCSKLFSWLCLKNCCLTLVAWQLTPLPVDLLPCNTHVFQISTNVSCWKLVFFFFNFRRWSLCSL